MLHSFKGFGKTRPHTPPHTPLPSQAAPLAALITVLMVYASEWGRFGLPLLQAVGVCLAACCITLGLLCALVLGKTLAGRPHGVLGMYGGWVPVSPGRAET